MSTVHIPPAAVEIDLPKLEKSLRSPRTLFNHFMSLLTGAMSIMAMVPLASVLGMVL